MEAAVDMAGVLLLLGPKPELQIYEDKCKQSTSVHEARRYSVKGFKYQGELGMKSSLSSS